jgi:chromosome segregation ATPase
MSSVDTLEPVIPFAPKRQRKVVSDRSADSLDTTGEALLGLLQQAAGRAEENNQRLDDLKAQLYAAQDRIAQLEQDVRYYFARADHAEKWMLQISAEIERFFGADDSRGHPHTEQNLARAFEPADRRSG